MPLLSRVGLIAIALVGTAFTDCNDIVRRISIETSNDSMLREAQSVTLDVVTFDLEVERIELYKGRHLMGTADSDRYAYRWDVTEEENGHHRWQAFAYDVNGYTWPSEVVVMDVEIGPRSLGQPPTRPGAEALCSALGSACVCSEPLNANQDVAEGFSNPVDSPAGSECNSGNAVDLMRGGQTVPAFGMPAESTVSTVWEVDYSGSYTIAQLYGTPMTLDQGTICTRMYQRFSDDYPLMGAVAFEERNKMLEMSGPWGIFQSEFWGPTPDAAFSPRGTVYGTEYSRRLSHSGSQVTIPDCKGSWCRVEQCVDRVGSTVTLRTQVTVVDTGKTSTHNSGPINGVGPMEMETVWIGNLYREIVTTGKRYISHGIQTHWLQAHDGWIGPAHEIEGR